MKKIVLFTILVFYSFNSHAFFDKVQEIIINKSKINVTFNSKDGKKRLLRSRHNNDFYQLVNFYQPQINSIYCSAASSVIILNALNYGQIESQKSGEITKPQELGGEKIPYKLHNQLDFFNENTDKVKDSQVINLKAKNKENQYDAGTSLTTLADILSKSYNLDVIKIHANKNDRDSIKSFRSYVKKHLKDDDHFILVNYDGNILESKTNGHISPLAAYDEKTDSVLIMDVAAHKNLWFFTPLEKLYKAMHSKDGDKYRGYLVISK